MSGTSPTYTKLSDRGVSFGVLRTNPKLTTNIKLTVDSAGDLWFNSIDATYELAQNKYKNFAISPDSNHEVNLFKFYDSGSTPSKISFAVGSTITTDTVAKDLKDQYDFDLYSAGAKYLSSKNYKEKFSYLAPLYLDTVLPELFVIFKITGASNYTVGEWKELIASGEFSNKKFAFDLFKKAVPTKVISLADSTKIGRYIRNILRNPMYQRNPLYVNFKENRYSLYRGASISVGTYVEIPEMLSSTFQQALPQLKLEKYLIEGFERNNIIYPRLLNLEFLFDDDTSDEYSFNRYIGFYCNSIDLAEFDIDLSSMYAFQENENTIPLNFREEDEVAFLLRNSNGVKLIGSNLTTKLTSLNESMTNDESIFFPYVKLKDDSLSFIKPGTFNQTETRVTFSVNDDVLDFGKTFGPGKLISQEIATGSTVDTKTTLAITFVEAPNHLDTIRLYHQNGSTFTRGDDDGRFDDIIFVSDYFTNGEDYIIAYPEIQLVPFDTVADPNLTVSDPDGIGFITTFYDGFPQTMDTQYISMLTSIKWIWDGNKYVKNALGSRIYVNIENATINGIKSTDLTKLAKTIVELVKNLKSSFLSGKSSKATAFIQVGFPGNKYGQLGAKILGTASDRILLNGNSTASTVYGDGGYVASKQAIVPIGNIDRFSSNLDRIVVKTSVNWSKVLRICNSVVSIDENTELTSENASKYFNYATFMLKDNEKIDVTYNKVEIREIFSPKLGVLSIFEMKDLDFYTYSSDYAKVPIIDLYQEYYVPKNVPILDFTKNVYEMVGNGQIKVNGTIYSTTDPSSVIWQSTEGLQSYELVTGDVILRKTTKLPENQEVITRQDVSIKDENETLQKFTGFFSFGADHSLPDSNSPTYSAREKYNSNNLLSEYHVYLENFNKDFAIEGRVIPYISKWGITNSTDARGNPYRLNSDIMFGTDNFGPSHKETSAVPEKLTHEWFYIESDFEYSESIDLLRKNNYYFNEPFNVTSMVNDPSYFETYFTYVPSLNGIDLERPQFRYSKLIQDDFSNQYYTVFNGAKFVFSELEEDGTIKSDTARFKDYNFSILLKPVKEDLFHSQAPIKYRMIENVDSKSIVVLIELALSGIDQINPALLTDSVAYDNSLKFPDRRLDQTSIFLDAYIINEPNPTSFKIDYVYVTENSVTGDAVFDSILNASYPSFSGPSFLLGTCYDPRIGQGDGTVWSYVPKSNETILIQNGSDIANAVSPIRGFVVAFSETDLFAMAAIGKLQTGCTNRSVYPISQYLNVSKQKIGYLDGISSQFRIIKDVSTSIATPALSESYDFVIGRAVPSFLSMFGDYRLKFNENDVSNLTYNFLYTATDKKYNSIKNSYSTVKLPIGVDLSPNGISINPEGTLYSVPGKTLTNIPSTDFRLENFVNPASGSQDTLTQNDITALIGDPPPVIPPLPAFAPLLFINNQGEVKILLNTSADFSLPRVDLELQLSDPTKTNHSIVSVTDNLLTLEKSSDPDVDTTLIKINLSATQTDSVFYNISKLAFPSSTTSSWLTNSQQFQLFGGKNYFANLFQNLSFGTFITLLEKNSSLISWESYENGILQDGQKIKILVEEADHIVKSSMVSMTQETVETSSKTQTGGILHSEQKSNPYELFRYSGEYDLIFKPVSGFKHVTTINDIHLTGANISFNTGVTNFFVIPEFSFVKYSEFNILDLEQSKKFEIAYPMIYESPIDFDSYSVLASSWDFDYHYEYSTKKDRSKIPGSRRVTEDYSFVSKLLNVPISFEIESFNWIELTNEKFDSPDSNFLKLTVNGEPADLAYSTYTDEIRFKINFQQVLSKALIGTVTDSKLLTEFQKFFLDENSQAITNDTTSLGKLTLSQYLYEYCKVNLLKLYTLDTVDFYFSPNHSIADNSINIVEVPYDQLDNAGYASMKTVKINNPNTGIINGSILKKSSSGINLVPKLKIKYI